MCDVTKENFEELYPKIKQNIENAAFISIDSEFTGLSKSTQYEPTLFDTPDLRYEKLKKSLSQFTVCQFGISAFVSDQAQNNRYLAHTYNFFVCPQSFGPIDARFLCQTSAMEFLTLHNFDFNQFIKHGVPFIPKDQEKSLRNYHKENTIQQNTSSMLVRQLDEQYITPALSKLDDFIKSNLNNETLELCMIPQGIAQYLLLKTIEKRFESISCSIEKNGVIVVKKVLNVDEKTDFNQAYEKIILNIVGFSRVMHLLSECKKPVIGHNILLDLLLLYGKFFNNLPASYSLFKKSIHELFPNLFDTKHMAFVLRKEFKEVDFFELTGLEDLYNVFSNATAMFYKLDTPYIVHAPGFQKYECHETLHEAGYDAYITGYVFLRLAHLVASKDVSSTDSRPFDFHEHFLAVKHMCNHVNIARAAVRYLNFGGEDPPIILPERFIVALKDARKNISASQVAQDFLPFGSVDVKLLNRTQALVAVSHRRRCGGVTTSGVLLCGLIYLAVKYRKSS